MLRLAVYFPNCVNTGTVDNGQWIPDEPMYAVDILNPTDPDITKYCDGEDYYSIPQVQVGFRWPLSASDGITDVVGDASRWDLTSLRLSSDHPSMGQDDGVSAHIDFMSGWGTEKLTNLMETCYWDDTVGAPQKCGFINVLYGDEN